MTKNNSTNNKNVYVSIDKITSVFEPNEHSRFYSCSLLFHPLKFITFNIPDVDVPKLKPDKLCPFWNAECDKLSKVLWHPQFVKHINGN